MIEKLSVIPGVSGCEMAVREAIINKIKLYCDDLEVTPLGNVIAKVNLQNPAENVILCAHLDESGFIVNDITDEGYLRFSAIGGVDPLSVISKKVRIADTAGIIAVKAVHLTKKEERYKPVKFEDLFIDIGVSTRSDAEMIVSKGDVCSFEEEFSAFGETLIKGKALESRAGCAVLINAVKNAKKTGTALTAVFTVQRHVYSRGIKSVADYLPPAKAAIVIDAAEASPASLKNAAVGQGVVFAEDITMPSCSKKFTGKLTMLAEKNGIKYQKIGASARAEADVLRNFRAEMPTAVVAIPCKYVRTSVNIMDKQDINAVSALIDAYFKGEQHGNAK